MDVGLGCRPVLGDEGGIVVYTVEVFGVGDVSCWWLWEPQHWLSFVDEVAVGG